MVMVPFWIKIYIWKKFVNNLFKKIYLFLERGEGRGKGRESNIHVWEKHRLVASHTPQTGDLATLPRHGPDQKCNSNLGSQENAQPPEPHQSGQK